MSTSVPAQVTPVSVPSKIELLELLSAAGSAVCQDFAAAAAPYGLTHMQVKVLTHVHRDPASMREIAEQLACDASNITGIVDRLEAGGFVRREVSPTDRRVKNVIATDAGRDVLRSIRGTMQAHGAVDTLDPGERATLYALLERLHPAIKQGGQPAG
ncbi:MarR family winged helix-turn-helix transcriptional regulator [Streptomyces sp. NPDC090499]|uniref:MarR family winged helix-turn-helix transcriptional regulator n=1 Tax=Streptomyces sp. NPDC090499 TaxID=3365965 RepID=UPI0037F103ED